MNLDHIILNWPDLLEMARTAKEMANFIYPGDAGAQGVFIERIRDEIKKRMSMPIEQRFEGETNEE